MYPRRRSRLPWSAFDVQLDSFHLNHWLSGGGAGLTYGREYEAREAARYVELGWQGFQLLPSFEKASAIAQWRVHNMIENAISKRARGNK